ncbi:hypothetical protein [Gluconobacter japonicus]|uniref:hypothetical protein n=1 Tax=Gluconobacter japonicus TaxID=376620 RepID=UPI000782C1DE|nr:hypothetical protein [Gluconobacter japonicus]KXV20649.1 hypothetical protein AD935_11250 [Gluconobacter japonicus]
MSIPSEITLPDGRKLGLKEIDPGDMLDLIEAAGSAMSGAAAGAWLGYAQMVATVTSIDGVPVQFPSTKDEVKELARKIGNTGVVELQKMLSPEKADEAAKDTAKN